MKKYKECYQSFVPGYLEGAVAWATRKMEFLLPKTEMVAGLGLED